MGKAQVKKKTQAWRHNPVRVPDGHLGAGKGEGKADPAKEKQMLPVLNKLKSPDYADRTWACAAICNLIQNDAATRRLFQGKNVVGELIERLSDSVDEVVVEASGALRNLAIDGGHELCGEMANKGLMSHLTVLIGKISNTIDQIIATTGPKDLDDNQYQTRKHLLALTENVISLLWSLAEASPKTLQSVNAIGSEGLLVKVLEGRQVMGLGPSLAAAQALYSLSQDNPPFRKSLVSHPTALRTIIALILEDHAPIEAQQIKSKKGKGKDKQTEAGPADDLPDGRALLRRVLAAAILRNSVLAGSYTDRAVGIATLTSETILPLVNSLLDVDIGSVCERVATLAQQLPKDNVASLGKDLKTDHRPPQELALERIERNLSTVTVALEVLTNICAGLEDEDEESGFNGAEAVAAADAEVDDDDEEMDDEVGDEDLIEMGRDPSLIVEDTKQAATVNPGATLSHLLTGLQLPSRLTALSRLHSLSFPPANDKPSIHPPTTSVLSALHLRALEALNNLLLTTAASLPSDADGRFQAAGAVPLQTIWESMFAIVQAIGSEPEALSMKGQEMRVEVLEMSLGCIWGVSKIGASQLNVQSQQVQILMDVIQVLKADSAKTRSIETLASLASRDNVSTDENKAIGSWLVQLTSSGLTIEVLVATLNAIIDIYADETKAYDEVFVQGGFLTVLSGTVAKFRSEVKKIDKRNFRSLRVQGEETYENLVAFIKYRRALRK